MKKTLSAVLAAAMMLSMAGIPMAADTTSGGTAAGSGDIAVNNTVKNPQYLFQVPKATDFAIDAFQKQETDGQIFSGSYSFINKSDVAIRASVKPAATAASGNTIVDTPSAVPTTGLEKKMYLEVVPATSATLEVAPGAVASETLNRPQVSATTPIAFTETDCIDGTQSVAGVLKTTNTITQKASTTTDIGSTYDLVIEAQPAGNWVEVARVQSEPTVAGFDGAAATIAGLFGTKKVSVPADVTKTGEGLVESTITVSGAAVTITADASGVTDWKTKFAKYQLKVVPHAAKAATAVISTTSAPTYAAYDDATGAATTGKVVVPTTADNAHMMTFALNKATYGKEYADDAEAAVPTDVSTTECVGAFRVMGTVNPSVVWAADAVTLTLTYGVTGMPAKDYTDRRTAQSGEQNLISSATDPTLASNSSLNPVTLNAASATAPITIKFVNGTNESKVAADSTFTVGIKNTTFADPADLTSVATLSITSGDVPTITISAADLIAQGVLANGANQFVVTFTATDGHVATLTTAI